MQAGREIKFRGKCIADGELNGEWVFGDLLQKNGKTYIAPHSNSVSVNGHIGKLIIMHEVSPESVGQFTCLRDKNGKEIYEGDIIRAKNGVQIGTVIWVESDCKYVVRWTKDNPTKKVYDSNMSSAQWGEVIGNIYEHPEMLQAG
jgi:uncharacterized phage protein (TIGR01671 family)